ncbi:MAG: hypothetical protein VW642_13595 [Halieaceae bacterium]
MSKKKKEPGDWAKLFKEVPTLRLEDLLDPICVLVRPLPPVPEGNMSVPAVQPELRTEIKTRPTRVLHGDHDVYGDGRVRFIAAEGHTPGHQVL